jgi:ABC-type nickel/cobalt efflux system permease component RcnA
LWILIKSIIKLKKTRRDGNQPYSDQKEAKQYKGAILSAFVVGSIPCPAVVMVMLFALSMDLIGLGIILGVTISVGMALTITIVVIMAMSGKMASLASVSKHGNLARVVESFIEIVAGLALMILGLLFLGANI